MKFHTDQWQPGEGRKSFSFFYYIFVTMITEMGNFVTIL